VAPISPLIFANSVTTTAGSLARRKSRLSELGASLFPSLGANLRGRGALWRVLSAGSVVAARKGGCRAISPACSCSRSRTP
jgi:hypothetical protein